MQKPKNLGKNKCKSIIIGEIWEEMGNPMPFGRAMGPNWHNNENYGDLQPITRSMKRTLWVLNENLSFGLLPEFNLLCVKCTNEQLRKIFNDHNISYYTVEQNKGF